MKRLTTPQQGQPFAGARIDITPSNFHLTITDREFKQLRELIYSHTGISLADHKRALVCSRLAKHLRRHGMTTYTEYYDLLTQGDPDGTEIVEMINAITTNKTDFFREAHHFKFLTEHVLPAFVQNQSRDRPLRIWSAGTSTGEEAYTLAMTALESIPTASERDVQIFATDIDTDVLKRAERGVYTLEQASHIPQALLHRYFLKGDGKNAGYVMVKPRLKSLIQLSWLNLQQDSWPIRKPFDIIFCRNVIIYFDKPTQKRLFDRMGGILKKGGYLMLGHSEAMHGMNNNFKSVGHSIYQNNPSD